MNIDNMLSQVLQNLLTLWNTILILGNFIAVVSIVLGLIYWLTNYDTRDGKRMVIGGIILFILLNYIAQNVTISING
ncbi:MAG: hypothetical protein DRO67_04500 [Candidatus Asgardarchaeum californiense]|nr:MAG: hypothetical protein DRO67_04500 [Candidatus Asgardarchaeum californiense]